MNTLHCDLRELKNDVKQIDFEVKKLQDSSQKIIEDLSKWRRRSTGDQKAAVKSVSV